MVLPTGDGLQVFYSSLFAGRSVEQCVQTVRREIAARHPFGNGTPEWSRPRLYLPVAGPEPDESARRFLAVRLTTGEPVPAEWISVVSEASIELSSEDIPGHRRWVAYCQDWQNLDGPARRYGLRHLARHLLEVAKTETS